MKTEPTEEQEVDFLAGVCPLNPDNLEDCQACQMFSQPCSKLRIRRVVQ